MRREAPNKGSWNTWLSTFELRERRYIESTLDRYQNQMRIMNTPKSRRPSQLHGLEFSTNLFTAVSAGKLGEIRYLICVERTK